MTPTDFRDALKGLGRALTGPRLDVLSIFEQANRRHLTVKEVHALLRLRRPANSFATTYRVLKLFTELGILSRSVFAPDHVVYELAPGSPHHHILCLRCDDVFDFVDPRIEQRQLELANSRGYHLTKGARVRANNMSDSCNTPK